ncbi:MAG: hypothetical protein ACI91O_001528 [Candidatus Poriferisodalaceae bacterium]|jgi:uncharacterized protein (TIGR03083 family)
MQRQRPTFGARVSTDGRGSNSLVALIPRTEGDLMSDHDLIISNLNSCWDSSLELFRSIEANEWDVPSLCPDWTVHGIAAHMVSVEQVLSGWMPEGLDTPPPFNLVPGYHQAALDMAPQQLTELMAEVFDRRRSDLAATNAGDFATPSITPVGKATYGRFMAVREFDFWMHERDCRGPLQRPTNNGGPTAEMALNEVHLSIGFIAGKKVGLTGGQSITFNITGAVERDIHVAVDGRAGEVPSLDAPTVTLHCDSMAFMNQACGRIDPEIPIAAGDITWSGDDEFGAHAARNLRFTM